MGEVKRYGPAGYTIALSEQAGGSLVNYSDYADLEAERDALRAENAKLRAACAAKDAALSKALGYVDLDNNDLISKCLAALKDDAGKGWIDATGAVEATAKCAEWGSDVEVHATVPDDWAGSKVLIVRVKP